MMNSQLISYMMQAHVNDLLRFAEEQRRVPAQSRRLRLSGALVHAVRRLTGATAAQTPLEPLGDTDVRIRYAFPDDAAALCRLAALDSAVTPASPLLVAEVDGELRAAVSLVGSDVIADPFHPTVSLVELLRLRKQQLQAGPVATGGRQPARPTWHAGVGCRAELCG